MTKLIDYRIELLDVIDDKSRDDYLDLWRACFGNKPKCNNEWFNWLNLEGPYGKNNSYVIRDEETNKMIAGYGLLPMSVVHNGKEHKTTLCTNVMTHPDFGKRGLFTTIGKQALINEAAGGVTIQVGIPNDNAIAGHMKVGWQRLPNLSFFQNNTTPYENKTDIKFHKVKSFVKGFDSLLDKFNEKYDFYFKKNSDFLNWRYVNHPYNNYDCWISSNESSYAVTKIFENKLHIVDYGYDTDKDFDDLLKMVQNIGIMHDVKLINLWKFDSPSPEDEIFARNNFEKDVNYNRLILYSDIDFTTSDLKNCHIVLGDNDVY
jgi:hypothetical protein